MGIVTRPSWRTHSQWAFRSSIRVSLVQSSWPCIGRRMVIYVVPWSDVRAFRLPQEDGGSSDHGIAIRTGEVIISAGMRWSWAHKARPKRSPLAQVQGISQWRSVKGYSLAGPTARPNVSPGQRPGTHCTTLLRALKGRPNLHEMSFGAPLQGFFS